MCNQHSYMVLSVTSLGTHMEEDHPDGGGAVVCNTNVLMKNNRASFKEPDAALCSSSPHTMEDNSCSLKQTSKGRKQITENSLIMVVKVEESIFCKPFSNLNNLKYQFILF